MHADLPSSEGCDDPHSAFGDRSIQARTLAKLQCCVDLSLGKPKVPYGYCMSY